MLSMTDFFHRRIEGQRTMADIAFLAPRTLPDALAALAEYGDAAAPIAGGTNLLLYLRAGRRQPRLLMDLLPLTPLCGLHSMAGQIRLGALTTLTTVLESPLLSGAAAVLRAAAADFGSPLTRNRATLGGNIADASPAADTAVPLLALDASVELHSASRGQRSVPLREFFLAPRRTRRTPDELLTAITVPTPPATATGGFVKLALRDAMAVAVVSVGVVLEWQGDVCQRGRIALGAVAPTPIRTPQGEALLTGQQLDAELITLCARACAAEASPIDDVRASAAYRRQMIEVLVRRLLTRAVAEATPQPRGSSHGH
jgi:carbon-monoxide dehydrogenase medium subunit